MVADVGEPRGKAMVNDPVNSTGNLPALPDDPGQFILYQTEDGQTRVEVRFFRETVWLSQKAMAELFQKDVRTISEHIRNVFSEGELSEPAVIRKFRITASDGKQYDTFHYSLDVIISVGYRVKSHRGTQFRIWATQRLREYLIKGFTLDDQRLKQAGGGNYFDELLARIRDIRSSEKVFWRKVLDLYATSIDYDPNTDLSHQFFATVQNKMHWAAHGHTAAEIVAERADAAKPHMGLTAWTGDKPRRCDIAVAKNYLNKDELEALNLIVSFYLDFGELQARSRKPMYMRDWITKLDDFFRLSERDILDHAGTISHDDALTKAEREYEKWRTQQAALPSPVEEHFDKAIKEIKQLEPPPASRPRRQRRSERGNTGGCP
jgi:hypothetical protein